MYESGPQGPLLDDEYNYFPFFYSVSLSSADYKCSAQRWPVPQCPAPGVNCGDDRFSWISIAGKFNLSTTRTLDTLKSIGVVGPTPLCPLTIRLLTTEEIFTVIYLISVPNLPALVREQWGTLEELQC